MKNNILKREILERIKSHYQFGTDAELAHFLCVKATTLSNWRTRDSLDWDLVITKCEDVDFNWLITGSTSGPCEKVQYMSDNLANSPPIVADPPPQYNDMHPDHSERIRELKETIQVQRELIAELRKKK